MYQDWVSPSFSVEQLAEFCVEFFKSEKIPTAVEKNSKGETIIRALIEAIDEEIQITIEKDDSKFRLTYPGTSQPTGTGAWLLGIFLTGGFIKSGTEKRLFLDNLEQQFWKDLDQRLADHEASISASSKNS